MKGRGGVPSRRHASLLISAHSKKTAQKERPVVLKELHKERLRTKASRGLSRLYPVNNIEAMWQRIKSKQNTAETSQEVKPKDQLIELAQEANTVLKHMQQDSSRNSSRNNSQTRLTARRLSADGARFDSSSKQLLDILKSVQPKHSVGELPSY